jgi:hypothetical protein
MVQLSQFFLTGEEASGAGGHVVARARQEGHVTKHYTVIQLTHF